MRQARESFKMRIIDHQLRKIIRKELKREISLHKRNISSSKTALNEGIWEFFQGIGRAFLALFGVQIKKAEAEVYDNAISQANQTIVKTKLINKKTGKSLEWKDLEPDNSEHATVIKKIASSTVEETLKGVANSLEAMKNIPAFPEPAEADSPEAKKETKSFKENEQKMKEASTSLGRLLGVTKFLGEKYPKLNAAHSAVSSQSPAAPADIFYQSGVLAQALLDSDFGQKNTNENKFSSSSLDILLEKIKQRDKDDSDDKGTFTFVDFIDLDGRSIQLMLKEIDGRTLTMALKKASKKLKEHILGMMSSRAATMIIEDLADLGDVSDSVVKASQDEIVQVAIRLDDEGKVALPKLTQKQRESRVEDDLPKSPERLRLKFIDKVKSLKKDEIVKMFGSDSKLSIKEIAMLLTAVGNDGAKIVLRELTDTEVTTLLEIAKDLKVESSELIETLRKAFKLFDESAESTVEKAAELKDTNLSSVLKKITGLSTQYLDKNGIKKPGAGQIPSTARPGKLGQAASELQSSDKKKKTVSYKDAWSMFLGDLQSGAKGASDILGSGSGRIQNPFKQLSIIMSQYSDEDVARYFGAEMSSTGNITRQPSDSTVKQLFNDIIQGGFVSNEDKAKAKETGEEAGAKTYTTAEVDAAKKEIVDAYIEYRDDITLKESRQNRYVVSRRQNKSLNFKVLGL
jgi:flagellar motor switch protein FliG